MTQLRFSGIFLVGTVLLVLWLSLAPVPLPSTTIQRHLAPFDHVLLYAGLTFVVSLHWPDRVWRVIILSFSFAVLLELSQSYVPVRAYETADLLGNLIGVVIGLATFYLIRRIGRFL